MNKWEVNMKFRSISLACVVTVLAVAFIMTVSCAPQPPVVYQGPGVAQAGSSASSGGIIVSQQSLGLWVNGLGKSTASPDVVVLSMGVQSQAQTVSQAQREAMDAMNKVMKVLKDAGIADKDIMTAQFSIQQLTRWNEKQNASIVIGYQVSNIVDVKIRNIGKAGTVIDSAAEAGGDLIRVNGISFTVDDPSPLLKTARDKAIQNAMDKAKQMAQASGVKLGRLNYISEGTLYTPPVPMYSKMAAADSAGAAPTPINPGELDFQVTVQLVYAID
jgi:uncharacterized protein YggE